MSYKAFNFWPKLPRSVIVIQPNQDSISAQHCVIVWQNIKTKQKHFCNKMSYFENFLKKIFMKEMLKKIITRVSERARVSGVLKKCLHGKSMYKNSFWIV